MCGKQEYTREVKKNKKLQTLFKIQLWLLKGKKKHDLFSLLTCVHALPSMGSITHQERQKKPHFVKYKQAQKYYVCYNYVKNAIFFASNDA